MRTQSFTALSASVLSAGVRANTMAVARASVMVRARVMAMFLTIMMLLIKDDVNADDDDD
jgi:hypothetical protein